MANAVLANLENPSKDLKKFPSGAMGGGVEGEGEGEREGMGLSYLEKSISDHIKKN